MELVSAVFNDTEVHFMRGLVRVFKRPTAPLKSATLWAGDRALYATYTLTKDAKDCVRTIIGHEYAAGPANWKHLWPDFTGLPGLTPLSLDPQFFRLPPGSTSDDALHAAALALIKSIDEAMRAAAPPPSAVSAEVAPGTARPDTEVHFMELRKGGSHWEVAAPPRFCGPGVQAAQPAPDANCVTRPDGEYVSEKPCMHSPPCPGCGKPTRKCLELPPKYAGCAAWRAPQGRFEPKARSYLDRVRGFQLRPPPQELLVLVDDQSEPP